MTYRIVRISLTVVVQCEFTAYSLQDHYSPYTGFVVATAYSSPRCDHVATDIEDRTIVEEFAADAGIE